jgi:hypothetical protein
VRDAAEGLLERVRELRELLGLLRYGRPVHQQPVRRAGRPPVAIGLPVPPTRRRVHTGCPGDTGSTTRVTDRTAARMLATEASPVPWRAISPVDERVRFIAAVQETLAATSHADVVRLCAQRASRKIRIAGIATWSGALSITLVASDAGTTSAFCGGENFDRQTSLTIAPGAELAGKDSMGGAFALNLSGALDCTPDSGPPVLTGTLNGGYCFLATTCIPRCRPQRRRGPQRHLHEHTTDAERPQ